MRTWRLTAKAKSGGFTLIEVLVSGTILALAILPTVTAISVGYSDVVYGGKMSRAVAMAEQKLEELKTGAATLSGFQALANGSATSGIYSISWAVSSVGYGAATADLRRVSVTVTWSQNARPGSYNVVGFISRPYS